MTFVSGTCRKDIFKYIDIYVSNMGPDDTRIRILGDFRGAGLKFLIVFVAFFQGKIRVGSFQICNP